MPEDFSEANAQSVPCAAGVRDILFRRPGEQAEIGAARGVTALDQLEPRPRQYSTDPQAQSLDFGGEPAGIHGIRQEGFDELDKDPTHFRRLSCEKVAPAGQFEAGGRVPVSCPL